MSLISLDHVSKIYPRGTRPALDDVSLHVDRGDFVFLVGASGSGKTTLLSLLLREEEANGGEIHVAGNDLRRLSNRQVPQYRRSLGFIFQDYKLLNNKTVYQNVAFALEVIGTSRSTIRSLVPRVLETVGLTGKENNYPHELSGGEAQRVAIARAYVNHPQIILADEPTGNLDPTTSLGIMEVLDAINRTGTTIVMATHNEEIVNSMRKRVVELHAGKIVRDEREGSYDSALYFPDSEVEHNSKAQQTVENSQDQSDRDAQKSITQSEHTERHKRLSKKAQRAAQAREVVDMVTQSLKSDTSENEGIARLAQSVHSGRTGRYGEVFQSLETTMTWGRGLISSNDNEDVEENDSEVEISEDNKESSEVAGNSETAETANTTETTETADNHETAETNESHESHETTENSEVSEESQSETGDELQSEAESKLQSDAESERKSQLPPMPPAPPKPPVAAENTNNENISVDDSNNDINKTEGAE
ncbi:cell division ATP-binding protein FtsE [Gardnerella swidsinskii]|jgi:cell division ATP-binding protein ftsE|uniref:cell division ATP-binding protein FtsE n=1 Tax=Gardnerella TaxID=2701 RepID=UPI000C9F4329|nr:cell division ATP-binding protein FtsE [Gardnerella sp. DNF01162]PNP91632.1 cell division ATP-binding protein FtsE [Gardnerella sp. DNF01162]RFT35797.1 cell division ATP-binding protein FtsE [Bifidobacteriaceae bacterium NR020]